LNTPGRGPGFKEFGLQHIVVLSEQGINDDLCQFGLCIPSWGEFLEGKKYLVFAERLDKDLVVRRFSRTVSLFKASEDLKELQRMSSPFYRLQVKRRTEQALGADSPQRFFYSQ
jgi:hypothetical protein